MFIPVCFLRCCCPQKSTMSYLRHTLVVLMMGLSLCPGSFTEARVNPSSPLSLPKRQATSGFTLVADGLFDGLGLAPACEQVLYQQINCHSHVSSLRNKNYHGSLGDQDLTDAVCATTCSTSLATARRRISGACGSTPEILPGYPVLDLIESVTSGWEETCLKDSTTGEYCNGT